MRRLLLLLICAGILAAQTQVTFQTGGLYCGMVHLAANQVQTYCYVSGGPPWVLVFNSVSATPVVGGSVITVFDYQVGPKPVFVWQYTLAGSTMSYQYTVDGKSITTGVFQ
jgi:hypothetical protein